MARPCISTCFTRPKTTSDRAGRCITPILRLVSLPFFLEEVLGRSAVETGLSMTPWPMAVGFPAPIAGWLVDRRYLDELMTLQGVCGDWLPPSLT